MKWEYAFATGVFMSIDDLQERLNALGRSGWEAIGVTQPTENRDDITVLLKRRHRPHYREVTIARSTASDIDRSL
jgi:hypothetical protein